MRWPTPKLGDKRSLCRFAFTPVEIDGMNVWLEFYYIDQEFVPEDDDYPDYCFWYTKGLRLAQSKA